MPENTTNTTGKEADMNTTTARPAHLTGTAADAQRRIDILRGNDGRRLADELELDSSALACADDAEACLARHDADATWVGFGADFGVSSLPQNYLEAALAWCDRGAQHQYGFRRPANW